MGQSDPLSSATSTVSTGSIIGSNVAAISPLLIVGVVAAGVALLAGLFLLWRLK